MRCSACRWRPSALAGCTEACGAEDGYSAAAADTCKPADVKLIGQVRNETNPYEAAWLDGGDTFAEKVGLTQERLTYDGESAKQQDQIRQVLTGDTGCPVLDVCRTATRTPSRSSRVPRRLVPSS